MAAKNDITGDSIQTRGASKQFESNFDQIDWSVKLEPEVEEVLNLEASLSVPDSIPEIELADTPQNGDQRLNNVGQLESYYGGTWIVRETRSY